MATPAEQQLTDLAVRAALEDPKIAEPGFDCSRVFALISVLLSSPSTPRKELVNSMRTIYLFHVTNLEGKEVSWWVDMKNVKTAGRRIVKLKKGEKAAAKAGVSIWVGDRDLVGLATGTMNPQKLFAAKRIRVRGNLDSALNVEKILSQERHKLERLAPATTADATKERGRWSGIGRSKL